MIRRRLKFILSFVIMATPVAAQQQLHLKPGVKVSAILADNNLALDGRSEITVYVSNRDSTAVAIPRRLGLNQGFYIKVTDQSGRQVQPSIPYAISPPGPPPTTANDVVLLKSDELYGRRFDILVRNLVPNPGKYTLRVALKTRVPADSVISQIINSDDGPYWSNAVPLLVR